MDSYKTILPGRTIGIIGGGQLGQMLAIAAKELGFRVGVLDPASTCPAGQVADWQIEASFADAQAFAEFARRTDVVTYEFENIDASTLATIVDKVQIPQGIALLELTQNRGREKQFLMEQQLPVVPFQLVDTVEACHEACAALGYTCVVKTVEGGYDGHGQQVVTDVQTACASDALVAMQACIVEQWVTCEKELSVMVARNERGDVQVFPVSENEHHENILRQTIVPARISSAIEQQAKTIARQVAEALSLVGVLGVEFFLTTTGELVINELAPRPHNSGHYTLEACSMSQFTAHIRALCNWTLPPVDLLKPAIMCNILGQELPEIVALIPNEPTWQVHLYGKADAKPKRKMGHFTILTNQLNETITRLKQQKIWIQ